MNTKFFLALLLGVMPLAMWAQEDDLYFTPKKKVAQKTVDKDKAAQQLTTYYVGSNRSVDEYNRRGKYRSDSSLVDTIRLADLESRVEAIEDYTYCNRMSRWDGFYEPWYYSYRWGYGPYWRYTWWDPWYVGAWYDPWFDPWINPWYAGWYGPWYGGYYGWYRPYYHAHWYYPYYGGGYITHIGGNPKGLAGYRSWSGPGKNMASNSTNATSSNRTTVRNNATRNFGRRDNNSYARDNGFGSTRSYTPSWSNGSSSSGSFGGSSSGSFGSMSRGGFGGGHSVGSGGGGRFGGGRR